MVFKNLCILVLRTKIALAWEGLNPANVMMLHYSKSLSPRIANCQGLICNNVGSHQKKQPDKFGDRF